MEDTRPQTDQQATERKRAWLNRYRESIDRQKHLAETLQELRSRSTSICAPLCAAKSAPTGAHSDRVADSVQRIEEAERRLQAEQTRGQGIAVEIINIAYTQLPLKYAQALVGQYIELLTAEQSARKIGIRKGSVMNYRSAALAALELPEEAP